MTQAEALDKLIAAVEAGKAELGGGKYPWTLFMDAFPPGGDFDRAFIGAKDAYNGSLDAAKALHEALLPGWAPSVGQNVHHGYWFAHVMKAENGAVSHDYSAQSDNPARAFLLAVLKAYRAGL